VTPLACATPTDRRLALALVALLAAGCRGLEGDVLVAPVKAPGDAGATSVAPGDGDAAGVAAADADAASVDAGDAGATICPAVAQTILLLDRDGHLASYDPRADLLRDRASIAANVPSTDCAVGNVSLALDRQGAAWITSCDGDLLQCDPDSGVCAGRRASTALPRSVHMAWAATDLGGGQALFLAAPDGRLPPGSATAPASLFRFPDVDRPVATLAGWPALTGTADRLWALFPGEPGRGGTPPRLAALDPASGGEIERRDPAGLVLEAIPALLAAFGGDLWVLQATGTATRVQRIGGTGLGNDTPRSIPRYIVGAASSPCSH
jgi:hypothetical protein